MRHASSNLRVLLCAALFVSIVVIPWRASASTLLHMDLNALTKASSAVVTGRVKEQWSRRSTDGRFIFTYSRVQVQDKVRGEGADEVVVKQPGGSDGEFTQTVHGVTLLQGREDVLLFVQPITGEKAHKITGFSQGMYRLQKINGKAIAIPRRNHALQIVKKNALGKLESHSDNRRALPLDALIQTIRAIE